MRDESLLVTGQLGTTRARARPGRRNESPVERRQAHRAIALLALVVIGARVNVSHGVSLGLIFGLCLAPTWIPELRRYRGGWALACWAGLCAIAGALLTAWSGASLRETSASLLVATTASVATIFVGTAVVLWARSIVEPWAIGVALGCGMILGISSSTELYAENAWKFGFSVPVTVILLSLLSRRGRRAPEIFFTVLLAALSALSDARSGSAILVLTALICVWAARPGKLENGRGWILGTALAVVLAVGTYSVAQTLILDGYLGEQTRARSTEQIESSGSLIVGGRPEVAATLALAAREPLGFGSGTLPTGWDVATAKSGMRDVGYDPDNGYVDRYLFGSGIELHSMIADLWAWFGIAGIGFSAMLALACGRTIGGALQRRTGSALVIFLALKCAWGLLFSPVYSSIVLTILFLGLALRAQPEEVGARRASSEDAISNARS